MTFIDDLTTRGVATTAVIPVEDLADYHNRLVDDLSNMIGYTDRAHNEQYYVLGSFGALGNPESFHLETVTRIRTMATRTFTEHFEGTGTWIQQLPDRLSIRRPGATIPKETAHRDLTPNLEENQVVYGGFINLDQNGSQYFSCVPGSQLVDPRDAKSGFVRESGTPEMEKIEVKPGHVISFRQDILHEIARTKHTRLSYRLYMGFMTKTGNRPATLHTSSVQDFLKGLSPCLPSGPKAPMYSANHQSCLVKTHTVPWCDSYLTPNMIVPSKKGHLVCPRYWYTPEQLQLQQNNRRIQYTDNQIQQLCLYPTIT
jgi:hypothetical protein